jgi:hypothetical protein
VHDAAIIAVAVTGGCSPSANHANAPLSEGDAATLVDAGGGGADATTDASAVHFTMTPGTETPVATYAERAALGFRFGFVDGVMGALETAGNYTFFGSGMTFGDAGSCPGTPNTQGAYRFGTSPDKITTNFGCRALLHRTRGGHCAFRRRRPWRLRPRLRGRRSGHAHRERHPAGNLDDVSRRVSLGPRPSRCCMRLSRAGVSGDPNDALNSGHSTPVLAVPGYSPSLVYDRTLGQAILATSRHPTGGAYYMDIRTSADLTQWPQAIAVSVSDMNLEDRYPSLIGEDPNPMVGGAQPWLFFSQVNPPGGPWTGTTFMNVPLVIAVMP